jgi:hypothetical protein
MKTIVRLGTCVDADREESAELAAIGRKRREREEKARGRKVEEDVVKDFRLGGQPQGLVKQSDVCLFKSTTELALLRGMIEGRSYERRR